MFIDEVASLFEFFAAERKCSYGAIIPTRLVKPGSSEIL